MGTRARPSIYSAGPQDAKELAALVAELAAFEGKTTPPASAAQLAQWLADPVPPFEALLARDAAGPLGYLMFYRAFSAFKATPVLQVENIYVRKRARRLGAGRALLAAAAGLALTRGWSRLELNVRADNDTAAGFYARLGFRAPGETVLRLDDHALAALADI